MMLHLMFEQRKRKVNLRIAEIRKINFAKLLARRFQSLEYRFFHVWRFQAARKPLPTTSLERPEITLSSANNAPKLPRDLIGRKIGQVQSQGFFLEMRHKVVRELEGFLEFCFEVVVNKNLLCGSSVVLEDSRELLLTSIRLENAHGGLECNEQLASP